MFAIAIVYTVHAHVQMINVDKVFTSIIIELFINMSLYNSIDSIGMRDMAW